VRLKLTVGGDLWLQALERALGRDSQRDETRR